MNRTTALLVLTICALSSFIAPAHADPPLVSVQTVLINRPGNTADVATGLGSVPYLYRMGETEVTNEQYAAFLNAKANVSDPLGLYNSNMGTDGRGGIIQSGSGPFTYSVAANMGTKPVNFVSWFDALRFANWVNNGATSAAGTETGAYTLLGNTPTPSNALTITRNSGASWFVPTENEWYKSAYYDPRSPTKSVTNTAGAALQTTVPIAPFNGGPPTATTVVGTGTNPATTANGTAPTPGDRYWLYPAHNLANTVSNNSPPGLANADANGNTINPGPLTANYNFGAIWNGQNGNVISVGSIASISQPGGGSKDANGLVDANANSPVGNYVSGSYYNTFDQGGNVWEWDEQGFNGGASRGIRGGSWLSTLSSMASTTSVADPVTDETNYIGFRIATVPEPGSIFLAALGVASLLTIARRRRTK